MNPIKKSRSHDVFPRARRRNSTGNKPASQGTHHASKRRSSLLKNNKTLALTLQETRCELSVYKDFYEECLECMNKTKLARSRMIQFSTALKDLAKGIDENVTLLDFDESKWLNFKATSQSNKNFQNGMKPVIEVFNEVLEDFPDQKVDCNERNYPEYSDQIFQDVLDLPDSLEKTTDAKKCEDQKSKSPREESEYLVESNIHSVNDSNTRDHIGNEEIMREVNEVFSKVCSISNYHQDPTPAHLPSQASKTTKIPRCHPLSSNLKRQDFGKEYKLPSKTYKRKSSENDCEESNTNFSKRKTYVLKSNNVLKNSESIQNLPDANDTLLKQKMTLPEDMPILSNDKRKTFVLKSNNIKESEPVSIIEKNCDFVSQNNVNETSNIQDLIFSEKSKRKTFVKKNKDETVIRQNEAAVEYQLKECAINLEPIESCKNSDQSKNITSSSDCPNSETIENRQIIAESSNAIKQNSDISSYDINMSDVSLKEKDKISTTNEINATDKTKIVESLKSTTIETITTDKIKIIAENPISTTNATDDTNITKVIAVNPKCRVECVVQDEVASKDMEKDFDFMNQEVVNDKSLKIQNDNEIPECITSKIPNSLFESSDSELDLIIVDEVDYADKQPAFKTPIRRQIPRKSKRKHFVFNKRKSVSKSRSSSKILNSEIDDACCQKNTDTLSDMNTHNNKEVEIIEIRQRNDALFSSEKSPKFSSKTGTVRKKIRKTGTSKVKANQETPIKNTKRKSTKVKKNTKKDPDPDFEIDDLISKPKKSRKKNTKKEKIEDINDADAISKFVEVDKIVNLNHVEESRKEKELESDFLFKKTGKNTFLVQAEIHPPPPSFNICYNKKIKTEYKTNFQNKQLVVVLDDVLKSKNIAHLNISNRDILCDSNISEKFTLSDNSNSFKIDPEESIEKLRCEIDPEESIEKLRCEIDPEESIEKLRCDLLPETDDFNLNCDEILDIKNFKIPCNPVPHIENKRPGRRRKPVNYKEPNLHQKIRRN